MDGCNPLLCILVYRPPKYNKDFISEFSDFLSSVVPNADRLLILGDFNIHVCCPSKHMVIEFFYKLLTPSILYNLLVVPLITKGTHLI